MVDWILANVDSGVADRDDMREVIEFMEKVFELIIKWMDLFPSQYMKFYEVYKKHKKTFLVDVNVAIAASGAELIQILDSCFRPYQRITKMPKAVKLEGEESESEWYNPISKKKDQRFKVALWYSFGIQGGFDALIRFCTATPIDTKEDNTIPLVYVNALLDSIVDIIPDFQNQEKKEALLTDIKKVITSQVENITDEDVEKLETSQLNDLLEKLKLFGSMSENSDKEMEEMMELKLCHKLLRCPIFERRRQGMVNLINIIEALEEDETKNNKNRFYNKKKKQYEWLTIDTFLEWVKSQKIIEYVYGEYSHPEIIRKSGELLQKMWQNNLFSKKEIDIMWSVFDANFHEDIILAVLDVIEGIVKDWDEETLDNIRVRIHKLFKNNDYEQSTIQFMKGFILAEMGNFYNLDKEKKTGGIKAIKRFIGVGREDSDSIMSKEHIDCINKDLELIWNIPTTNGVPDNVKAAATKAIPEILSNELCSDKTKEKYIDYAKKSIKKGEQIFNNLWFIKTFLINSQYKYGEIKKINTNYDIFGLVLTAAESYQKEVSKEFKNPYDFNNLKAIDKHLREKNPRLMCGRTHKDHIEKIFEIIQYLLERIDESSILKNSELEKMFSVFITKRVSNFESETLFDLISSVEKNQRGYSTEDYLIADKKVRKYIFQTCLCKKNFVTPHDYSPKSIRCFKDLFLDFNNRENKIQMDRESTIIKGVKDIELEGIETLWQIALQASNPVVQERAGYLLALIHYIYMDKKKFPEWSGITDGYVKELMETLKINTNDKIIAANNMRVLKQFIDTFETLDFPEHFRIFYKKLYEVEDDNEEEIMDSKFYNFYERKWNRQNLATFAITHKKTGTSFCLQSTLTRVISRNPSWIYQT